MLNNILRSNKTLAFVVAALAMVCVMSIFRPINFEKQRAKREEAVRQSLLVIRSAQERYLRDNGYYAPSLKVLASSGYMEDSLRFIPFSDEREFRLSVSTTNTRSGRDVPLMECGALYDDYLYDLDANSLNELNETAAKEGRYAGLKIGDINTPNDNAGNWE